MGRKRGEPVGRRTFEPLDRPWTLCVGSHQCLGFALWEDVAAIYQIFFLGGRRLLGANSFWVGYSHGLWCRWDGAAAECEVSLGEVPCLGLLFNLLPSFNNSGLPLLFQLTLLARPRTSALYLLYPVYPIFPAGPEYQVHRPSERVYSLLSLRLRLPRIPTLLLRVPKPPEGNQLGGMRFSHCELVATFILWLLGNCLGG